MAYENTGYARKKTITITKGSAVNTHSITASFTFGSKNYPALTDDAFAKLPDSAYEARLTAFVKHLYSLYEGLETDCPDLADGSLELNTIQCPLK